MWKTYFPKESVTNENDKSLKRIYKKKKNRFAQELSQKPVTPTVPFRRRAICRVPELDTKQNTWNFRKNWIKWIAWPTNLIVVTFRYLVHNSPCALLVPIWTYGIQFWVAAKKSNTNKIPTFQLYTTSNNDKCPPLCLKPHTSYRHKHNYNSRNCQNPIHKRFRSRLTNH